MKYIKLIIIFILLFQNIYAFAEDEKDALNAGMNVHLAKPIDVGMLKKVINQLIQKGSGE